ncbi:MAG TPA: catalase family peroxidase [Candidatus Acidoferrales bacterium]
MEGSESKIPTPASLLNAASLGRLAAIGVLVVVIGGLFLYAGGWLTPHELTPAGLVNTFEHLNGVHDGFRRNHAKGVGVTGYFESNGQGQALSKAQVFQPGRVPVIGRFALAGGMPFAGDTPQNVRSLALLLKSGDGEEWRTGMINIPIFPVNNPRDFQKFLVATSPDPLTGKVDGAAVGAFLGQHPETAAALKILGGTPPTSGFSDAPYYGLNAFRFVNAKGESTPVRWWIKPDQTTTTADASTTDKNYLFDAVIAQIHSAPLRWHLMVIVGQPGDSTAQAASQWPADRQQIDVGTVTIDAIESEDTSPVRDINFDPTIVPDGISVSDDPLLSARAAAYSKSFTRREGEKKTPSAVSTAEVQK